MRVSALLIAVLLSACGSPTLPPKQVQRDPSADVWYGQTVAELDEVNLQAKASFQQGNSDVAAALIEKGQALSDRLLAVPRPTLAATEAASDVDQLYGQMLLSNRNYGWARLVFQKNVARWKHWKPQTSDTTARLKQAQSAIAECDRRMSQ